MLGTAEGESYRVCWCCRQKYRFDVVLFLCCIQRHQSYIFFLSRLSIICSSFFQHSPPVSIIIMSSDGVASRCRQVVCAACSKTFKRLAAHISQSPACSLLYTESHDPNTPAPEVRQIDDARLESSVAALPTPHADNADDEVSTDNDEASSNGMEVAEDVEVSSDDKEVSSDDEEASSDVERGSSRTIMRFQTRIVRRLFL